MLTIPFILAAGSLPTLIFGAPIPSSPFSKSAAEVSTHSFPKRAYSVLGGTGAVSDGWPSMEDWYSSFEEMFEANKEILQSSCAQWDVANNSDDEIELIAEGVKSVASSSGVDARFIFAIILQESNGCVRVPTTDNGVVNPGLMQSHDGAGSCNSGSGVQSPCPASEITQMITDGAAGTSAGDGLKQCLAKATGTGVTAYYQAARLYNSGSISSTGNLGQGIATHCYVSDIANRLTGWSSGASSCDAETIGELTSAVSSAFSENAGLGDSTTTSSSSTTVAAATTTVAATTTTTTTVATTTTAPATTTTAAPTTSTTTVTSTSTTTSITTVTATVVPIPATTSTTPSSTTATSVASSSSASSTAAPIYPYATSSCQKYYTVQEGDYCLKVEAKVGITAAQLLEWNTGLDEACTNLWLGYQYCIKA
ncbi:hypothetical protein P175DRAFT_0484891 [Aspergillus ochraceoroseus IBT 24754]|uniref:LysM domain-containing protein n=3 Tax=Aspergillus subgen. Nidulantes TaxID=2720870 RepID=A0A0F8WV94_9EURO|nr:uncharacterized protein P175DRAFT_0484891 [Aspergillus ochraceoroseus IBT 24754]KKK15187.1 hypothetical protein ARAM_002012 [Aspergillus rambellii]KKK15413.1 hypothetical protein AOCH_001152 [Aspergillus ochraceoroseus]PTU17973.1 hypothetical protein P175DRAFT_0484891 [Aspergillus ochraceoroseus IBT 24754]